MKNNLAEKSQFEEASSKPMLTTINGGKAEKVDPLDEITFKKTKRQHIREFGAVIALALALIAAFKLYKNSSIQTVTILASCSAVFYTLCALCPRMMQPVFKGWMSFAKILETVMTRVILGLMWLATFLPIGIVFRVLGKSPMVLGFEPNRTSYWEDFDKSRNDFSLLSRQY